ncbi:MAG: helix-turn-helix transcriptional regulator [Bacteroidales bacterium]|nr:helix-turn-helix transcriptional regulator [Bacteroidales bacterium]
MNKRLQQFLETENLTQAEFAERVGFTRGNISHILSGRNRPGYEFFENLSRNYPSLSLDWLLTGRGRMYKPANGEINTIDNQLQSIVNQKEISKIIVFFSDGSFSEFSALQ